MLLTLAKARKRASELRRIINHHRFVYHTRDEHEISDDAYDRLFQELEDIEDQFPTLRTPDSPTQKVGGEILSKLPPAPHKTPMLSLLNAFEYDEVSKFDDRIRKELGVNSVEYAVEPKIDGLALSLTYTNGRLTRAATRGDGTVGELVTSNVAAVNDVPKQLNGKALPSHLEIRGELYMSKQDFADFNEHQRQQQKKIYANARNLAAGSIRQLDSASVAERPLKFFAYSIAEASTALPHTQSAVIDWLEHHGMPVIRERNVARGYDELIAYYNLIREKRPALEYMIDGVVYKLNDLASQKRVGFVARAPKFALAHKYPPERVTTKLEEIQISVGRTGALTPVARLAPVHVGGVIVTSATLHNEEEVNRKRLKKGRDVYVQRAGDVIPEVVEAVDKRELTAEEQYRIPDKCPECGSQVVRLEGESIARCTGGLFCRPQLKRTLLHYGSRRAMDIVGIGERLVDVLVDELGANGPADLYRLDDLSLKWLSETESGAAVRDVLRGSGHADQEFRMFLEAARLEPTNSLEEALSLKKSGQMAERALRHLRTIAIASIPKGEAKIASKARRPRIGEKDAIRLQVELEKSKSQPLYRFIFALGIPHVGEEVAKIFAKNVQSVDDFVHRDWNQVLEWKEASAKQKTKKHLDAHALQVQRQFRGVGEEIFLSVVAFLSQEHNVAEIERLQLAGVRPPAQKSAPARLGPLTGKTFVFTGRFASIKRSAAERAIEDLGGEVLSGVSEKLDYLVVGDLADPKPSNKRARATELNKRILSEAELSEMLEAARREGQGASDGREEEPRRPTDQYGLKF